MCGGREKAVEQRKQPPRRRGKSIFERLFWALRIKKSLSKKLFPRRLGGCFRCSTAFSRPPHMFYHSRFRSRQSGVCFKIYFMDKRQLLTSTRQEIDKKVNFWFLIRKAQKSLSKKALSTPSWWLISLLHRFFSATTHVLPQSITFLTTGGMF